MKKQKGFSLIEVLIVLGILLITLGGGVVVWERKVLPAVAPTPTSTPIPAISPSPPPKQIISPTQIPTNAKYLTDEKYCEKDSDCTIRPRCCNPCYKDYVNIYHKDPIPKEQCQNACIQDCPPPRTFGDPVCQNNKCTSATSTTFVSCQISADCPPSLGVCAPGNCPSWRCINDRCVYFKDAKVLDACLNEVKNARRRICEELGVQLDEYGNCVGVDFVRDPYQECYDKYGQK